MALKQSLTFGTVTSSDYGIYIGGEGTFNAPKRSVEIISIPGRNGDFILDNGHFENVELTYTAISYEKDLLTFAQNLSDFRNALASQKGYQKLSDSFNPTEYRMAAFVDGVSIDPIKYNTAAEFEIKFNCKPQRYLMNGESAITVTSGDTILNPTLFDAKPMLEVEGYGDINIGDSTITLENVVIGETLIASGKTETSAANTVTCEVNLKTTGYENGDSIYNKSTNTRMFGVYCTLKGKPGYSLGYYETYTSRRYWYGPPYVAGTPSSITAPSIYETGLTVKNTSTSETETFSIEFQTTYEYNGSDTISCTNVITLSGDGSAHVDIVANYAIIGDIYVDSTASALGDPTYIDLDIGEAYMISDGVIISLNNTVALPANLPELSPGANEITYDNTITDLKVIPRWWKI